MVWERLITIFAAVDSSIVSSRPQTHLKMELIVSVAIVHEQPAEHYPLLSYNRRIREPLRNEVTAHAEPTSRHNNVPGIDFRMGRPPGIRFAIVAVVRLRRGINHHRTPVAS